MRSIRLVNVTKIFGDEVIIENLNLTIPTGKFFVLWDQVDQWKNNFIKIDCRF